MVIRAPKWVMLSLLGHLAKWSFLLTPDPVGFPLIRTPAAQGPGTVEAHSTVSLLTLGDVLSARNSHVRP